MQTTNSLISSFLKYNKQQSQDFVDPGQQLLRKKHRAQYPVQIAALTCMDGRLNIPVITRSPVGIIRPFRTIGGKFDIGGHFGELLEEWVMSGVALNMSSIVLVSYHWSKSSKECGCKGFAYEVDDARAYMKELCRSIEDVFGKKHEIVYPIRIGVDTDTDSVIIHGSNGQTLDLSKHGLEDASSLEGRIRKLFPDMNAVMVSATAKLCVGNLERIAEVRALDRPISVDHEEAILGVGRGFDWYYQLNRMLIVGPYSYDLASPIAVAAKIILGNIKSGRISKKNGCALIASAPYRTNAGPQRQRVVKKAQSLLRFARQTIEEDVPELLPYLQFGAGIVDEDTRLFTPVPLD